MNRDRILIIDDDRIFTETLARALTRRGLDPDIAGDTDSAIALATRHRPARAVLDLKLGSESGLDLIEPLKAVCPDMVIVMLTGYSSIATAVAAIKLGARNYVCKPADADEILAAFADDQMITADTLASSRPPSVRRLQWEHVQKVLRENDDNISATARSLGMHRRSLQRYLQKKPVRE